MVIKSRDKLFVHGYVVDRAGKALVYKVSRLAVNTIRNFILLIFEKHYILLNHRFFDLKFLRCCI